MGKSSPSARLLVVDDEVLVCGLLRENLSLEGFDCKTSLSGEEALEILAREPLDLIISDLQMPGISGLTLLEQVHIKWPRTAFVIVTGLDDIRVGVEAMKQGAADYLVKPFQMEAVVASVHRALGNKRMELELENYRQNLEQMVEHRTKQLRAAMKRVEMTYDETLEALGSFPSPRSRYAG